MMKKQGVIEVHNGNADTRELLDSVAHLPKEGTFLFYLYDDTRNRPLPQLKYLFGTVLKTISDQLPDHPSVESLYRYFEEVYAPIHTTYINGEKYEYFDLKNEKSIEMDDVIGMIIHHAAEQWGIKILSREELSSKEAQGNYADAQAEMWKLHLRNK
jgi:hypothetical protein